MCGRYTLISAPEAIRALFGYVEQPNFPARFNIAPTQPIAVVRLREGQREFALLRWGFMPAWVKDPKAFSLIINARGETVLDKPAFRNAMRRRRCLIPADGFYEWQARGKGPKQPFYFYPANGEPMAFAGLWETWMGPNGEEVDTAAIVTTTANETLAPVHHRMPVIVPPAAYDLWLHADEKDVEAALSLIRPAPDDYLSACPVSTDVNRTANDNAQLISPFEPVEQPPAQTPKPKIPRARAKPPEDSGQGSLF